MWILVTHSGYGCLSFFYVFIASRSNLGDQFCRFFTQLVEWPFLLCTMVLFSSVIFKWSVSIVRHMCSMWPTLEMCARASLKMQSLSSIWQISTQLVQWPFLLHILVWFFCWIQVKVFDCQMLCEIFWLLNAMCSMLLCTVLISFGCRTRLWGGWEKCRRDRVFLQGSTLWNLSQFPVCKSSWRPQSFLCVLGLYLMTMKALGSNSWLPLLSVILNACVGIVLPGETWAFNHMKLGWW